MTVNVTQSGVSDDFKMLVPIYADFGKGWTRLGAAKITGNASVEIPIPLPQAPKKVTLCALDDVLYTSLDEEVAGEFQQPAAQAGLPDHELHLVKRLTE